MLNLILTLFCLTGMFSGASQDISWKEFTSDEGKFTVALPDEPHTNLIATETREGTLYTHTFSSTDRDLNEYMVAWTEYQKESIEGRATEKTFGKMRDGLMIATESKLVSESSENIEGHPSRIITLAAADGRLIKARFSFIKNRFYEVMAQIRKGDKELSERFLNSFRLLGN